MKNKKAFDVLIIGGGVAGLTAAIYSSRYALNTAIVSLDIGGIATTAHKICNYPSYKEISGFELMNKVNEQVKELEVSIFYEEVKSIYKKDDIFFVKTSNSEYTSKKIIFAAGMRRKKLNVPGEEELLGRGVSYCATCDGGFFKDKIVAVVGGSDAALSSAMLLSEYAKKVYILHRRNGFFKAEPAWTKLVKENKKIKSFFKEEVISINGKTKVESIKLKFGKELKVDGVFIEVGSEPSLNIIEKLNIETERGYISTNKNQETNLEGFYAAGDITNNELKQIVTAASQGAIAANNAYKSLIRER
jgi:thioredoxin reductase (NADPH)